MSTQSKDTGTTRDPRKIEADLDQTRARMGATLDALQDKLSPGQLFDEATSYLRGSGGGEFASNLKAAVTHNPVPVTMVGIGLAWLAFAGKDGGAADQEYYDSGDPYAQYPEDLPVSQPEGVEGGYTVESASIGESPINLGQTGADDDQPGRMKRMASGGRERAHQLSHGARHGASRAGAAGRRQAARAKSGFEHMLNEQPLVLGAIGVALGAALAAGLPGTRHEDELMGDTRDRFMDRAQAQGKKQLDQAKRAAKSAGEAAKSEAKNELDSADRQNTAESPTRNS